MNSRWLFSLIISCMVAFLLSCKDDNLHPGAECVNTADPGTLNLPATRMKGWEIYSWPACGNWNFSLLYGTNALKSYNEVTGSQPGGRFVIRVWGKDELKKVLRRVPTGETVSLIGEGWLRQAWGAGTYNNLKLPPAAVINELQQAALQASLDWQVLD